MTQYAPNPAQFDIDWLRACGSVDDRLMKAKSAEDTSLSHDEIRNLVKQLFNFHPFPRPIQLGTTRLFRVRPMGPNDTYTNTLADIWHPPKALCNLGRFNYPNQPRLYLSGNAGAAIGEVGLETYSEYLIGQFEFKKLMNCLPMSMVKSNSNSVLSSGFNLSGYSPSAMAEIRRRATTSRAFNLIESYIVDLATRRCHGEDNNIKYPISSALAEFVFGMPNLDALIYPAHHSLFGTTNYCISPDFAKNNLTVTKLWKVRSLHRTVTKEYDDGSSDQISWFTLDSCTTDIEYRDDITQSTVNWDSWDIDISPENEMIDIGIGGDGDRIDFGPLSGLKDPREISARLGFN